MPSDTQWVREEAYGSPAFGGIILGTLQLVWGLILGIMSISMWISRKVRK